LVTKYCKICGASYDTSNGSSASHTHQQITGHKGWTRTKSKSLSSNTTTTIEIE
jgi:hypothetical protein